MAYEKQTWHTGDVITEGKLNHMEDGIAAAYEVMMLTITVDTSDPNETKYILSKTWKEINDFISAGGMVWVKDTDDLGVIHICLVVNTYEGEDGDPYGVEVIWKPTGLEVSLTVYQYDADTENDYPARTSSSPI